MFVDGERAYESGVFYCKDAFEGLETMDRLRDPGQRDEFTRKLLDDARHDVFLHANVGKDVRPGESGGERSAVRPDAAVPSAPFLGSRVVRDIPLDEVFALLDLDELYRLQWGGRGSGAAYDAVVRDEFEPARRRLEAAAARERPRQRRDDEPAGSPSKPVATGLRQRKHSAGYSLPSTSDYPASPRNRVGEPAAAGLRARNREAPVHAQHRVVLSDQT